jgi:hypothetical protein
MSEQIYVRSASSDRDYHWYRHDQTGTMECPDPEAWEKVNGLLVHDEPCMAVLRTQRGACACVVTGLLSPRTARSRLIYDAWIIEGNDGDLSDLQKDFLKLYFSDEKRPLLASLSRSIRDLGRDGVQIDDRDFQSRLSELMEEAGELPWNSSDAMPVGVFLDSEKARQALAQTLGRLNGTPGEGILAIVTSSVPPSRLQGRVKWGLTDHSLAKVLPEPVVVVPDRTTIDVQPPFVPTPAPTPPPIREAWRGDWKQIGFWLLLGTALSTVLLLLWLIRRYR